MLLIAGLGNPGGQYAGNRHNVGFMAVDLIHDRHGFGPWRRKFQGLVSDGQFGGEKCLLIKPQTYMNESGRAVGEAMRFFKLDPSDVLVIHDEVDLAPGKIRMKAGGGVAGHNGLRSVGGTIGNDFRRLRIGVGHPGVKDMVPIHVLHDFAKADKDWLAPLLDAIADHAPLLAAGNDQTFSNRIHETLGKDRSAKAKKPMKDKPLATKPEEPQKQSDAADDGPLARSLKKLFGR
ncbi:aminoacyl-tRNA hydrolase [Bauldia sp.]|uniref:aminoacyl-tRNA hydrolase n=1 Tax=Bauldia sp. TaxID=2575872 RepID=UPI003BA92A7D